MTLSEAYGAFEALHSRKVTAKTHVRVQSELEEVAEAVREACRTRQPDWPEMAALLLASPRVAFTLKE